jgi:hypothetical protein
MSYHRMGEFEIPTPPTEAEIARNRLADSALVARIKGGAPVTREQVLYMFDTMPIVGCFGGPVPEYPSDVKAAVERMPPGAIVPPEMVARVYRAWSPGGVR